MKLTTLSTVEISSLLFTLEEESSDIKSSVDVFFNFSFSFLSSEIVFCSVSAVRKNSEIFELKTCLNGLLTYLSLVSGMHRLELMLNDDNIALSSKSIIEYAPLVVHVWCGAEYGAGAGYVCISSSTSLRR